MASTVVGVDKVGYCGFGWFLIPFFKGTSLIEDATGGWAQEEGNDEEEKEEEEDEDDDDDE